MTSKMGSSTVKSLDAMLSCYTNYQFLEMGQT